MAPIDVMRLEIWITELEPGLDDVRSHLEKTLDKCAAESAGLAEEGQVAPAPAKPSPLAPDKVKQLIAEIKRVYARGEYDKAYSIGRKLLVTNPGHGEAMLWCTLAACKKNNARQAKRHFRRLGPRRQGQARQLCSGIDFGPHESR